MAAHRIRPPPGRVAIGEVALAGFEAVYPIWGVFASRFSVAVTFPVCELGNQRSQFSARKAD
jgi:hypothetical protein